MHIEVVELTETSPLAELLSVGDLDQGDLVLAAKSDDELLVGLLLACLVEHAHVGLATVKGLGGLTETTGKTVVDEGDLEHALERVEDRHAAAGVIRWHLDLLGRLDLLLGYLFSVRLRSSVLAVGSYVMHVANSIGGRIMVRRVLSTHMPFTVDLFSPPSSHFPQSAPPIQCPPNAIAPPKSGSKGSDLPY
jgi:hypothetical protein